MPSLLLCRNPTASDSLCRDLGIPEGCIRDSRGGELEVLRSHTPYLLGACHDPGEHAVCSMLQPHGQLLTEMCFDFGASTTLGLADLTGELRRYGVAGVGAGADLYSGRIDQFVDAVREHQRNMVTYHQATRKGAANTKAALAEAHGKLVQSGSELNQRFARELELSTQRLRPRQRTLMSDRRQMPELVRKEHKVARLDVGSQIEAHGLVDMSRHTRLVGRTMVIVDLGLRADEVLEAYESGDDWQRKAFVESAGFAASVAAGRILTGAALATLDVMLAATPVGWVVILGAGLVAAGVIVAGSSIADYGVKYVAGVGYDFFGNGAAALP